VKSKYQYVTPVDLPDKHAVKQRATVWSALWMPVEPGLDDPNVTQSAILNERQVTVIDFYRGRPATPTPPRALGGN
jgi:hypothetical protein